MDVSYNPHAERARRKNRSSTNINHLTLAPLTAKLPINDDEILDDSLVRPSTSYLQGKSAPTTPRLLTSTARNPRSRSRSHNRTPSAPGITIAKSKSSSHLPGGQHARRAASGTTTPRRRHEDIKTDGDWLLRTGALMTLEAREYKGQNWLVSRQSSTSLTGMRTAEEEAFERELAREREIASRRASRRGSMVDDDMSIIGSSRVHSRFQSRSHSIVESQSQVLTPMNRLGDDYFPLQEAIAEPDFVDLDEKLEELERDTVEDDEADVRRLMRRNSQGKGSWITNMIGWSLFSVEEHEGESDEDSEDESLDDDAQSQEERSAWLKRHCEGPIDPEELIPPPEANQGGWSDAAWLLSVATKVIF
ncbi:hypothetical protein PT974_10124 [Cladobotryum mycophilum]|uniref:DUF3984 domain-containing protein n=1 Tax=Cladobotryum mycophilum TaxID=491253 RepID=A0ABR0S8Y4_9HYPO